MPPDFASLMLIPCAISAQRGDAVQPVAVLVDVDRDRRALLQRRAALVAGLQRLLAVRDAELRQLRQRVERLVERPPLVHVDLQRQLGDAANGANALDIEAVAAAELQFQPLEAGRGFLGSTSHVVGIAQPDGPRGRRPGARQAEELPRRQAEELPLEIVERTVESGARGVLAGRQPGLDLLERERVVAEQRSRCLQIRERRLDRLVVPLDRRPLTEAGELSVPQLDLDDIALRRSTRARSRTSRPAST